MILFRSLHSFDLLSSLLSLHADTERRVLGLSIDYEETTNKSFNLKATCRANKMNSVQHMQSSFPGHQSIEITCMS